jgi:hypothetical protein
MVQANMYERDAVIDELCVCESLISSTEHQIDKRTIARRLYDDKVDRYPSRLVMSLGNGSRGDAFPGRTKMFSEPDDWNS